MSNILSNLSSEIGETLFTVSRRSPFSIEAVFDNVVQIRVGKSRVLVELPVNKILEAEKILLERGSLKLKDFNVEKSQLKSYILAILAYVYHAQISKVEKCVCISVEKTMSPDELEKILKRQKEVGYIAEMLVIEYETEKLRKCGKGYLVNSIDWVSQRDCTAGYDIRSFNENGDVIYIEVKGTSGDCNQFEITKNELEKAKQLKETYFIYRVMYVDSQKKPEIVKLCDPFNMIEQGEVKITPAVFLMQYKNMI
ncbi:MAG: DUF3883 domain-containing protein [Peptococcia bacterium]